MTDLIARIEALDGPDREADAAIALALSLYDQPEDLGCFEDPAEAIVGGGGQTWAPLAYTGSIDAAMTLVPEGWGWKVRKWAGGGAAAGCYASGSADIWRNSKTPALALCAAALRARGVE